MDMPAAFEGEVRAQCPQAEIVFDLFHAVMKYGREVVGRVRVDEANRLKQEKVTRKVVKGAKWLLLRNWENLPDEDAKIRLNELLEANQALMTVYLLKDGLKQLWDYKREGWARRAWNDWLDRAQQRHCPAHHLRREPNEATRRHPRPLPLCHPHPPDRGREQQNQTPQTHRLRLPGRRLLLPQDPLSLPRNSVKNQLRTKNQESR
jgi:hypothetical protein